MPVATARRALLLVCVMALGVSTSYTNHGPVLGFIRGEFALDAASAGAMATAFFVGAAILMLPGGALADRWGLRRLVTLGFLVTCLGTIGCGLLAPTYPALLAWRVLGGLGGGLAFAAGAAYTRGIFADRGQHLAQGLFGSSFLAGSAIPLLYMPLLAGSDGDWRRAYLVSGVVTLAAWAIWWRLAPAEHAANAALGARRSFVAALGERNSWLLALCHMCGFGLAMVLGTWVVSYLTASYGVPLVASGLVGALVLVLGIAGRSGGGLALERGVAPIGVIRAGIALAALGLATMALSGSLLLAIGGLFATGVGVGLPYAAVFNGAAASVPASPAATQGFVGTGGVMTAIVGPPLVGWLLDVGGGYASGFLAISAFAVLVLLATLALRPFSFTAREGVAIQG